MIAISFALLYLWVGVLTTALASVYRRLKLRARALRVLVWPWFIWVKPHKQEPEWWEEL
jgi:hypothetical protein